MNSPDSGAARVPVYTDGPFVVRFFRDDAGTLRARVVDSHRGNAWVVVECDDLHRLLSIPKEQR
jgi:hypothetical protein